MKTYFSLLFAACLCFCNKNKANPPAVPAVTALNGINVQVSPQPVAGSVYEGIMYISYAGGNGAAFETGTDILSTGVNNLKAVLQKGVLEKGTGHLVYKLEGRPSASGTAVFNLNFGGQTTIVQIEVGEAPITNKLFWGFFDDSGTPMSFYDGFGKKPSMAMMFNGWTADGNKDFPIQFCRNADAGGYLPHITWEPMMGLPELMSGKYDNDIRKYGEAIAAFGKPVILRFAHEFNGDWYPWSILNEELVPASVYVTAFKYVHAKIRAAGATNAHWVWAPNNASGAKNPQSLASYYPGDEYVDLIGMDGYNFGTSQTWSSWQSFSQIFSDLYGWIQQHHPNKPVFISEMGTSSTGGSKAAWINDMFVQLKTNFPKVISIVWFNIDKETDWRFNDVPASIDAFKAGLNSDRVLADPTLGGVVK